MTLRASQVVVEALVRVQDSDTRVSQLMAEVLVLAGDAPTYGSQLAVEALVLANGAPTRTSQLMIEALIRGGLKPSLVSQIVAEVLVWSYGVPMPALYPVLAGLGYSVTKRPKWFTGIGTSTVGREVRVAYATAPLWEFDLTYDYLPDKQTPSSTTASDFKTLIGFYCAMAGAFAGFAFEDPDDNTVTGQVIGVTAGSNQLFVISRTFGGGDGTETESIGWLNGSAPFNLYLDGTPVSGADYTLVTTHGCQQQVRFNSVPTAGQVISVDCSYYFSCRFKEDTLDFEKFMDKLWSIKTVTLMSQRN